MLTLARALGGHPRFAAFLSEENIILLAKSAPLHDIGKVGIPDNVLLKPGKLTADEWGLMKTHAEIGATAIERAGARFAAAGGVSRAGQGDRALASRNGMAAATDGLARDAIPVSARADGAGGRVRCPDQPARKGADAVFAGTRDHRRGAGPALRPGCRRRLSFRPSTPSARLPIVIARTSG